MQMRTSDFRARFGWLAPFATLCLLGCPKQELAPLGPCTVSAVREDVSETGISKVDLLFVIDNSFSMASEQANLITQLPRLIEILTTGDKNPGAAPVDPNSDAGKARYFTPVSSLHLGVITTELAVMKRQENSMLRACLTEHVDPRTMQRVTNDDAQLQTSVEIGTNGQLAPGGISGTPQDSVLVVGRDACRGTEPELDYLVFETAELTPAQLEDKAAETSLSFGCIASVGVLGCAYEQQLEATWKALAPSNGPKDFLDGTSGNGNPTGRNAGFLRDDAILATIIVTDEEDCSITEDGRVLFDTCTSGACAQGTEWGPVPPNLRCGKADEDGRDDLIHNVDRYISGLKSLKPDNPDLIIFAGLIGIPQEAESLIAQQRFDDVLALPDMQFRMLSSSSGLPQPSCSVIRTQGGQAEDAYPGRRIVQTAKGFGENAALFSICRESYQPAVDSIIERIASKLKGNCLPRQLTPDESGLVRCEVYELLAQGVNSCKPEKGHIGSVERRTVIQNGERVQRNACRMRQVPTGPSGTLTDDEGWYYDSFSQELKEECAPGEQQRIVFTQGAQLDPGSGATFECFQPVQSITANARGFDAINTRCDTEPEICADRSNKDDGGYDLICIEELRTCQVECSADPDCPPGWVCANLENNSSGGDKFCQLPTCQTGGDEATSSEDE